MPSAQIFLRKVEGSHSPYYLSNYVMWCTWKKHPSRALQAISWHPEVWYSITLIISAR